MSTPTLSIRTAPFGHPHYGRPLIEAAGREVAWCNDPQDAALYAEFLGEHPALTTALAEAADEFVDSPSQGWSFTR